MYLMKSSLSWWTYGFLTLYYKFSVFVIQYLFDYIHLYIYSFKNIFSQIVVLEIPF